MLNIFRSRIATAARIAPRQATVVFRPVPAIRGISSTCLRAYEDRSERRPASFQPEDSRRNLSRDQQIYRSETASPTDEPPSQENPELTEKRKDFFAKKGVEPTNHLYVGNLPYSMAAPEIYNNFKEFGDIREVRVGTTAQGWHKGFAHVEFVNSDSVADVLMESAQNEFLLEGRPIRCDLAQARKVNPKPDRQIDDTPTRSLFIGNFGGTQDDFVELIPTIKNRLVEFSRPPNAFQYGFAHFETVEDAIAAKNLLAESKPTFNGSELRINWASPSKTHRPKMESNDRSWSPRGQDQQGRPRY